MIELPLFSSDSTALQYDAFDAEDYSIYADMEAKACVMSWEKSKKMRALGDLKQAERVTLAKDIRATIKGYREAMLFESTLASLKPPPQRTFDAIHRAFLRHNSSTNKTYPILADNSKNIYQTNEDLVLLYHSEPQDKLTRFIQDYLPVLFKSGKPDGDNIYVSERRISHFVNIISTLIAVVLLIIAIIILHLAGSPAKKLTLVRVFILLFAISVGLFTTAKRSDMFAATAAYAAVLVVFVSGNLGG